MYLGNDMHITNGWFIVVLIAMGLSLYAQTKITTTFSKNSRIKSRSGLTGAEVAKRILNKNNIYDVEIQPVAGNLTDHYDPINKVLRLSQSVYNSNSVAAIAVSAHECGHAIQHNQDYLPLRLRSAIAPVVSLGSRFVWVFFMVGLLISPIMLDAAILLYLGIVLFQVVTLPVEINASKRALVQLQEGIIYDDEIKKSKDVLSAAALTYIAATLMALGQLLRLIAISNNRRRD